MTNGIMKLDDMALETLAEMANEAGEQVEKTAQLTVQKACDAGRYLTAAKDQLPHGEWAKWLGVNWNYSQKTACQYMLIASNFTSGLNLKEAGSVSNALRMISDSKPETAPRSERKPVEVHVSIPVESAPDPQQAEEIDDDPTPDPPTIRKTAAGSEKVSEDKKPRTQVVPVEIIDDEPEQLPEEKTLADFAENEILEYLVSSADDAKRRAKALRKAADKLDPPKKFTKPDLDDVVGYMATLGDAIGKDVVKAADGFMDHYESNGWMVGKVAMKDWQATARKWLKNQGQFNSGSTGNDSRNKSAGSVSSRIPPNIPAGSAIKRIRVGG